MSRLYISTPYAYNAGNPNDNTDLVEADINTSDKLELMRVRAPPS
jgi:hypothetical protein